MTPTTCLLVSYAAFGRARFTLRRDIAHPAFVVDDENIKAVLGPEVTIPLSDSADAAREVFAVLFDLWTDAARKTDAAPVYVCVDFGDGGAGFAVLVPSEEGWETMRLVGVQEVPLDAFEALSDA